MTKVTTRFPTASDFGADTIERLSTLINAVYDEAESGMWKRKGTRTSPAEVERLLRVRALVLAELDCTLVADANFRAKGIGAALIDHAESWARQFHSHTMRLELLTPRHWTHPSKEFLKAWYTRLGYVPQATEPFEILHPELVPELATECDFTVWHKPL